MLAALLLTSIVFFLHLRDAETYSNNSIGFGMLLLLLVFLICLHHLSRRGFQNIASLLFVALFFLLSAYMGYRWGVDVNASLLLYALVVVMTGVLLNSRAAFVIAIAAGSTVLILGKMQAMGIVEMNRYWRSQPWTETDSIMLLVILGLIAIVSWLSNREIESSLKRARRSEEELKKERDMLEVRVRERTRELQLAQMENMRQSYRMVEFGRLTSGLMHDLTNPLTALSLNIENMTRSHAAHHAASKAFREISEDIERAKQVVEHMTRLTQSVRKHLAREGSCEVFSVRQCVEGVMDVMRSYARPRRVALSLETQEVRTLGDPASLGQVVSNLVSNAIEAFDHDTGEVERRVVVRVSHSQEYIRLEVEDNGPGIPQQTCEKIFEPFFSTKSKSNGLGIGLALSKRVIEQDFGGSIAVERPPQGGTRFVVSFPIREP